MLQRFIEKWKKVKVAMLQLNKDFNASVEELPKINEVSDVLALLETAVRYLCQENIGLILSEKMVVFTVKKLNEMKTPFGNALLKRFQELIREQHNCFCYSICNSQILLNCHISSYIIKFLKNTVYIFATKLLQWLFKAKETADGVSKTI